MKIKLSIIMSLSFMGYFAQNVGINSTGAVPSADAALDVSSTDKGILIPRLTTAEITAMGAVSNGLLVFNTTKNDFVFYNSGDSKWYRAGKGDDNDVATVAPTVNDDAGDGYDIGSLWTNITTDKAYICVDPTTTAAVWIEITGVADGDGIYGGNGTTPSNTAVTVTDNINFDANTLYVDGTNNRIGIGTATPYDALDVNGDIRLGKWADAGSSFIGYANGNVAVSSLPIAGMEIESVAPGTYSQNLHFYTHEFATSTGKKMTIQYDGNVGIGTSAPNHKLQIEGGAAESILNLTTTGNGDGLDLILGTDGHAAIWLRENDYMHFATNNSERMRIDAAGHVGIGNNAPTFALDVAGNDAGNDGISIKNTGGGNAQLRFTNGAVQKHAMTLDQANDKMYYWNASAGNYMVVDGTDVGFGTNAPTDQIHIVGTSGNTLRIEDGNQAAGRVLTSDANGNASWTAPAAGGDGIYGGNGTTPSTTVVTVTDNINFDANTLYIDGTNDKIGIGATNPVRHLTISRATEDATGQIELRTTGGISAGNFDGLYFTQNATGSTPLGSFRAVFNPAGFPDLAFYTRNGAFTESEKLRILNNGNVGIGTTSPNAALQLGNVVGNRRIVLWENGNNDHQYYGLGINAGVLRYQVSDASEYHVFYSGTNATTSSELMRISGNGNVGIGTNNPTDKLHVEGTSGNTFRMVDGNQAAGRVLTSDASGNASWAAPTGGSGWETTGNAGTTNGTNFIGTTDAQSLDIRTNNIIRTRITQKGQIEVLNTGKSIFIGEGAGALDDLSNNENIFIGRNSGVANITGVYNTFLGNGTGALNTGNGNVFIGFNNSPNNTNGYNVVSLGVGAGNANTDGYRNTYIGTSAGDFNSVGFFNTFLGYNANTSVNNLSNATAIGANAVVSQSNALILGSNADIGIGTSTPATLINAVKSQNAQTAMRIENLTTGANSSVEYQLRNDANEYTKLGIFSSASNVYGALSPNNGYIYTGSTAFTIMADDAAGVIKFATGGNTERMRLNAAGNLGIGQPAPSAKLDVVGTTELNGAVAIVDGTQGANKILTSDASGNASWSSNLNIGGSVTTNLKTVSAAYTVIATDHIIVCDGAPSSGFIVSLPTAVGIKGRQIIVKKLASGFAIDIDPNGTETIDGLAAGVPYNLTGAYKSIRLVSNGVKWFIIGSH